MNAGKQYHVYYNQQQSGPMRWDDLMRRNYPPDTLVWSDGMTNWQPLSSLMPWSPPPPPPPGSQNPNVNISYAQSIYASFGQRLGAHLIDGIILSIVSFIYMFVFRSLFGDMVYQNPGGYLILSYVGWIGITWMYYALLESSDNQATLGKMALSIKVVDMNHQKIDFARATGRFFGKLLSMIILFIGFLMALWSDKTQTLHDQLADTLVLRADRSKSFTI